MKVETMYRPLICSLLIVSLSTPAFAHQAVPTPASPTRANEGLGGPVISGVCLLSREAVLVNSRVGAAATQRLQQLATAAESEIAVERRQIDADITTFRKDAVKMTPEARQAKDTELAARLTPLQAKATHAAREIEATRIKITEKISAEAQPVIAQVYGERKCGLLLDRTVALGGNLANDLTAAVVQGLDKRIQTINFDRERLPQQSAK